MRPASSIIIFTVISGLGYGIAIFIALGLISVQMLSGQIALILAGAMIVIGLMSSTFHLGHPERAWRALSQWRSSWLSREGVLAVVTFIPLGLLGLHSLFGVEEIPFMNAILVILSLITIYCTSMIYASLKTVYAWNHWLTSATFLLFALTGGLMLTFIFQIIQGDPLALEAPIIALLIGAWAVKFGWWKRLDTSNAESTPESATGLGQFGDVRILERPHLEENYLTHEMGFKVARKHAKKLRMITLIIGLALPLLFVILSLLLGSSIQLFAIVLAALLFSASLFVERWLFFAEAKHSVMLFYGEKTA